MTVDAGQGRERLHVRAGVGAYGVEPGAGMGLPDERQDLAREPGRRVGIRPVVHVADEDEMRPGVAAVGRVEGQAGREALEVHAVLDRHDAPLGLRRQLQEAAALRLRDQERALARHRRGALVGQQRPRLARPDQAHGE